jgi:hypothetical protein
MYIALVLLIILGLADLTNPIADRGAILPDINQLVKVNSVKTRKFTAHSHIARIGDHDRVGWEKLNFGWDRWLLQLRSLAGLRPD